METDIKNMKFNLASVLLLVSASAYVHSFLQQEDMDEDYVPEVSDEELAEIYSISENIDENIAQLEALGEYLEEGEAVLIMGNYRSQTDLDDAIYVYESYKDYATESNPVEVFVFNGEDYDMDAFFTAQQRGETPNLEDYKISEE